MSPHPDSDVDEERKNDLIMEKRLRSCRVNIRRNRGYFSDSDTYDPLSTNRRPIKPPPSPASKRPIEPPPSQAAVKNATNPIALRYWNQCINKTPKSGVNKPNTPKESPSHVKTTHWAQESKAVLSLSDTKKDSSLPPKEKNHVQNYKMIVPDITKRVRSESVPRTIRTLRVTATTVNPCPDKKLSHHTVGNRQVGLTSENGTKDIRQNSINIVKNKSNESQRMNAKNNIAEESKVLKNYLLQDRGYILDPENNVMTEARRCDDQKKLSNNYNRMLDCEISQPEKVIPNSHHLVKTPKGPLMHAHDIPKNVRAESAPRTLTTVNPTSKHYQIPWLRNNLNHDTINGHNQKDLNIKRQETWTQEDVNKKTQTRINSCKKDKSDGIPQNQNKCVNSQVREEDIAMLIPKLSSDEKTQLCRTLIKDLPNNFVEDLIVQSLSEMPGQQMGSIMSKLTEQSLNTILPLLFTRAADDLKLTLILECLPKISVAKVLEDLNDTEKDIVKERLRRTTKSLVQKKKK